MNNAFKRRLSNPLINYLGSRRARRKFSDAPIIIGGCARTGTSLLLSILAGHPRIFAVPTETGVFSNWEKNPETNGLPEHVPQRMDRIHRSFLSHTIPGTVTRWCEKTPSNVRHIEKIFAFFDERVKFIHLVRDGRDVLTSVHPERPEDYWVAPGRWVSDTRAGLAYRDHPGVLTLRYEDLVSRHEQSLELICQFLGEEMSEEFRHWFEHSKVRRNRAWCHPLKQVHTASLQKWKKPEHAARMEEIMDNPEVVELLKELGYVQPILPTY